jgi:CheY-like chemotaxis protein
MAVILIIDDEKSIRNVLKDILQHEGYQVEEAPDGEQGIKLFSSNRWHGCFATNHGIESGSAGHYDQWPWHH